MVEQDDERSTLPFKPVLLEQSGTKGVSADGAEAVIDLSQTFEAMKDASQEQIRETLDQAFEQHRALDAHLTELQSQPSMDMLEIARLKKTKLGLKDLIARLRARLVPDIIA